MRFASNEPMNVGFYQSVGGMKSYWEQQQTIAANLSRASIPGNRQGVTAFMSAGTAGGSEIGTGSKTGALQSGKVIVAPPVKSQTKLDFSQGSLEPTGDPLNLAIEGSGLFTVREKSGSITYTRNGSFRWNTNGQVTTEDGAQLLGVGNQPISVSTTKGLRIDEAGSVYVDDLASGKIAVAHFKNPSTELTETGNGRFTKNDGVKELTETGPIQDTIRSGYLESSNGNPITQMVSMIDVMRSYEANQKALSATDDATAKLIKATGS